MLYFGAISLTLKSYCMDIVFARNRWFLVSIVPRWYELYSSDFLFPPNAGTLKRCPVSGFGRLAIRIFRQLTILHEESYALLFQFQLSPWR
jgi:hypothetical protein